MPDNEPSTGHLTIATVQRVVRDMGLTCSWHGGTREYRIDYLPSDSRHTPGDAGSAAFCTDGHDAIATARAMALLDYRPAPTAQQPRTYMRPLSVGRLLDVTNRAHAVITTSDGHDEHGELIADLESIIALCRMAIGSSHMGVASGVVILSAESIE